MAHTFRSGSRRSETPSSSSSGASYYGSPYHHDSPYSPDPSNASYTSVNPQYPYYSTAASSGPQETSSPYGTYSSPSPPQFNDSPSRLSRRASSAVYQSGDVSRHSSYPGPVSAETSSERASKRQRSSTQSQSQAQRMHDFADGYHYPVAGRNGVVVRSQRPDRASAGQGGGYYSPHDPYSRHPPFHSPSSVSDAGLAGKYGISSPHPPSSDDELVEHGPTELPPRSINGKSHFDRQKKPGRIPGSAMDYLPILEERFARLETAIDKYVDLRGQQAIANSILPGTTRGESSSSSRYSRESVRR